MNESILDRPRRRFLKWLATTLAGTRLAETDWFGKVLGDAQLQASSDLGLFRVKFADFTALRSDNGSVRLRVTGMPTTFPEIVVTRLPGPQFFAVTSRCTHQGCTVGTFSATSGFMQCPCHGSRFRADGAVVRGPATRPLQGYTTHFAGRDELLVEIPGLGFRVVGGLVPPTAGQPARYKLMFPTLAGLRYQVLFRESLSGGDWMTVNFATTPGGAATQTVLQGTGATATVYVYRGAATGFYAITRS
jgi:Rieske Fe-S protein